MLSRKPSSAASLLCPHSRAPSYDSVPLQAVLHPIFSGLTSTQCPAPMKHCVWPALGSHSVSPSPCPRPFPHNSLSWPLSLCPFIHLPYGTTARKDAFSFAGSPADGARHIVDACLTAIE